MKHVVDLEGSSKSERYRKEHYHNLPAYMSNKLSLRQAIPCGSNCICLCLQYKNCQCITTIQSFQTLHTHPALLTESQGWGFAGRFKRPKPFDRNGWAPRLSPLVCFMDIAVPPFVLTSSILRPRLDHRISKGISQELHPSSLLTSPSVWNEGVELPVPPERFALLHKRNIQPELNFLLKAEASRRGQWKGGC
jgi:hypothetical protein